MFSISQIILIVLSFLLIGVSFYLLFAGKKRPLISYHSLLRYLTPLLFVLFICSEITYLVYYSKFLYYFGLNAAVLIAVTFAVLAIPVYGLLPKEKLQSFVLKRKKITEPKAVSIPIETKPEEQKITERPLEKPAAVQYDTTVPQKQIPEFKPVEPIEKLEVLKEVEVTKPAEPQAQETAKAETKPVTAEHKKAAVKKPVTKKPSVKKEAVKKTEVKKEEAKPVELKHVEAEHPKKKQVKTAAEKTKQNKQTKPRTKK